MCECPGDGSCLIQSGYRTYEKSADIICNNHCEPVKCPNFKVCGASNPLCILHFAFCIATAAHAAVVT